MKRGLHRLNFVGVFLIMLSLLWAPFSANVVHASINPQINFQGKLTNTNGTNVTNGTYSIVFSIYTVSSGGSAVWTETQPSVTVTDGIFRVALGSVTSLPGSVDFNSSSLYLGIKVGSDAEMTPRVQFTATPYAFNSDKLGGLSSSGFVQIGPSSLQADSTTNTSVGINKSSTGNFVQLQQSSVDMFTISNAGDITFGQNAAHTITVSQESTSNTAGNNLTLSAGQAGGGTGATGGNLILQGGQAGGTNGSGGNVTIAAGALSGSGSVGTVLVKNPSDSTTSFQVQDSSGAALFYVDTTNDRVYVGATSADATGVALVLDTKNTSGDPTGVVGAMYYNSNTSKFRCYEGSAWYDCVNPWITIRKTANQDVTNTATLANDTELTMSVTAATTYVVRFYIVYSGSATGGDYKGTFTFPAAIATKNVVGRYTATSTADAVASSAGVLGATTAFPSVAGLSMGTAAAATDERVFEGYFSFQPNSAGTFVYKFAQAAAGGAGTVARTNANSFIEYQAL